MIELKNITKKYGGVTVYENFDFAIEESKITCILGESGSGKTTLLNMLAGLTPYSGTISPSLTCSYIFQQPRLVPSLTVMGNLSLVCKDRAAIRSMLARVGLEGRENSYPRRLSGGQAQRVAIARAFLYPSRLMLLDEPFSSLDLALKIKMAQLFLDIRRSDGRTAVFVTHDVDEALMLANDIAILRGGRVVRRLSPEGEPVADLFARQALRGELISALVSE